MGRSLRGSLLSFTIQPLTILALEYEKDEVAKETTVQKEAPGEPPTFEEASRQDSFVEGLILCGERLPEYRADEKKCS